MDCPHAMGTDAFSAQIAARLKPRPFEAVALYRSAEALRHPKRIYAGSA
jgi:hypothetical protein